MIENGAVAIDHIDFPLVGHCKYIACIISDIKRNVGGKSRFFHTIPPLHSIIIIIIIIKNVKIRVTLS